MRDSIPSVANNPAGRWPAIQLLGHVLLTAAVLVAAGAWLVSFDGGHPTEVPRRMVQRPGPGWGREQPWPSGFETVYLVGTEDAAASLRAQINELNAVQMILGVPLYRSHVIVTESADDARVVIAAIREGNGVLAAFGAEDRAVNLRTD